MTHKKRKYKGRFTHKRAILHMIGECVSVFNEQPKVADVAAWMNVSKVTATKYLKQMEQYGEIIMTKKPYKNTFVYSVRLTADEMYFYRKGHFKIDYNQYAEQVMGIVLQDA